MDVLVEKYISVLSFLTYVGAFNGFLLTLIFLTYRKGNNSANKYFVLILLVLTLRLTDLSLFISGESWRAPFLAGLTYPLLYLIGPAFYLYSKKLWDSTYKLEWIHLAMLVPVSWALWESSGWIFYNLAEKAEILKNIDPWFQAEITPINFIKFGVLISHSAIYLGFVVRNLRRYQKSMQENLSDNNSVLKLKWLKTVSTGLFLYVVGFFITMTLLATLNQYGLLIDRAWIVVLTFFIHAVGFLAIQQPYFFSNDVEIDSLIELPEKSENAKYKNSPLEEEKAEEYYSELNSIMEMDKIYLNPDLKASEVAARLDIPIYQLSHLLSLKSEYSFFDYVNKYRVEEAKRLLTDSSNDHLTILAIGFEAGFNNKSSFNRAFKKFTGETPSYFKKEILAA